MLEEEVRFRKARLYGRASKNLPSQSVSPEHKKFFNEAQVLAAIATTEAAEQERTTDLDRSAAR